MLQRFLQNLRPNVLRAALAVKIALLIGVALSLGGEFYFGDKPATAQEEAPSQSSGPDAAEKPNTNANESASDDKDGRESFLSGLLNLPELDPESLKKEELGRYLTLAERKKRQIEDRLDLLKKREQQLKSLENSIDEKLRLLDEERRYFAETLQREKDLKGKRLERLIKLYEKMDPGAAAAVMEKMDDDLVVALFNNIPKKQVTAILEEMTPERSVELTEYFGRIRSGREYKILKQMNKSLEKAFDDCKGMPEKAGQ